MSQVSELHSNNDSSSSTSVSPSKKNKTISVLVVVSDGSEEIESITPVDVLKRAGADVTIAACNTANDEKLVATLSRGVRILCDTTINEAFKNLESFSAIVIPGLFEFISF